MGSVGKEVKAQVLVILVLLVSAIQPLMAIRPLDDQAAAMAIAMPEELSRLVLEVLPRGPVHQGPSTCTNVSGHKGASCPNS
ncbi:hypothetical protein QJS10_CPB15g01965 [Acorus calamus]|uniref:Uncharacterized protein n=1 Tax=Acorus calamus TaxID=4465 RepID=A0AAV9D5S7_ACOCL|nr:hypothetical protein QJS10_CPB15g01965 [Acorus calamus]